MTDIKTSKGPKDLTTEKLISMAEHHVKHYEMLVEIAHKNPNVRVSECLSLIKIWKGVQRAATDGLRYDDMKQWPAMRQEIHDAWWEEYDTVAEKHDPFCL